MKKEQLITLSKEAYQIIQKNIDKVHPSFNIEDEVQRFYYGSLRRQLFFTADINVLLKYGSHKGLSSIFIVCRSIIDDFMILHFIHNYPDPKERIEYLNSHSHNLNFKKLRELAKLNEEVFEGKFPYYPTSQEIDDMEDEFKKSEENEKYFKDINDFKFYRFQSKKEIAESYTDAMNSADIGRIYFLWRHLSDYVHYSNYTFDFENNHNSITNEYHIINEIIYYAYLACKICMEYFDDSLKTKVETSEIFESMKIDVLKVIHK